jgi:hypothetical protein
VKFMKIFRVRFMKFNMQNGENYARSAKNWNRFVYWYEIDYFESSNK